MASGGYPNSYATGLEISGLDDAEPADTAVFTAGVATGPDGRPVTSGGRVLTVVSGGDSLELARGQAYARLDGLGFEGAVWRTDIAALGAGVNA